ncbi:MAG: DUF4159 domain-containing protein [Planctomycetota bacterium]
MRVRWFTAVVMTVLAFVMCTPAFGADPAKVDTAIAKGVKWLYARQSNDGRIGDVPNRTSNERFGTNGGQWGGLTALATYTLLAAGEDPQSAKVQKSVTWLTDAEIIGVYALGMRASVWPYMPETDQYKQAALKDAQLLIAATQGLTATGQPVLNNGKPKRNLGLYDYLADETNRVDMSVSQYGVLGVWAVSEYVEIPPGYWRLVQDAWLSWQQPNGGWAYLGNPSAEKPVVASMTTAGIATLFLTQDMLPDPSAVRCNGNRSNPALDKAMDLFVKNYPQIIGKGPKNQFGTYGAATGKQNLYTLYGVERIGVASGLKYFGEFDWYASGAEFILSKQQPNGSWGNLPNTCFALLFLSRGREPVMMNKLDYTLAPPRGNEVEARWNQRPRDVANAALYTGKQTERTLNWQIIDVNAGPVDQIVDDLHDAPILYISGDQPLFISDDIKAKLKQYLLEGGMIIANPDCNNGGFKRSLVKLAGELFPDQPWDWRTLPQNHPIYTEQQFKVSNWRRRPNMQGLSNGVRELILLLPNDMAKTWQSKNLRDEEDFQLAANLYLYAIDKNNTLYKGETYLVEKDPKKKPAKKITVGRIEYNGNWNPEPAGWDQLAAVMHNEHDTELVTETVTAADLDAKTFPIVHMTGTSTIADAELVAALETYINAGGVLIADAAGGNSDFATSFEQTIGKALGPAATQSLSNLLPADHALYGGKPMDVDYRPFAQARLTGSLDRPSLRAHEIDGKLAVIYSPLDLTAGLLGNPVDGINGYTPESAQDVMATILKHAAKK